LGVARAIERDRAEVEVASLPQRAGVLAATLAPGLTARAVRILGAREIARKMGEALYDKR
jgi:hypothetical protein